MCYVFPLLLTKKQKQQQQQKTQQQKTKIIHQAIEKTVKERDWPKPSPVVHFGE